MGDKPARYWDFREAAWVRYTRPAEPVPVPVQPQPADDRVGEPEEPDVRSG